MGEWAVANVVEEDGELGATYFFVGDGHAFGAKDVEGTSHEIEGSEHVGETGVGGSGIDKGCESELLDAALSLKEGMLDDLEYDGIVDGKETVVDRVIDNFVFGHSFNNYRLMVYDGGDDFVGEGTERRLPGEMKEIGGKSAKVVFDEYGAEGGVDSDVEGNEMMVSDA